MTIGTDVPNVSIKHDKIDKEQIDRATAINTDFEISGKKTSAEDLGFNTDIDKVQEKTKDEEKHLDAELHTDLIGEDKRNEIKYAYKKLGSLHEILDQKKFKESMEGVLLDKFKDEHQNEFNLIKDENLSLEDKQKLTQNLVERYLRENGYQGVIPEVLLTDEAHSFTVDSKDKETGAKRREKIYFSINDIADPNLAFSRLFGHEKAHMNTYDEGKYGEETSIHTREKIGSENKNKVFTEGEKIDYLNNLRNKYKNQKSIEQQFAEAKLVPEKDKEHWAVVFSENAAIAAGLRFNGGSSIAVVVNPKTKKIIIAETSDFGVGIGTLSAGYSPSIAYFHNVNTVEELEGVIGTAGISGSLGAFSVGGDVHFLLDTENLKNSKILGGRISAVPKASKLVNSVDFKKYILKSPNLEAHASADYSYVVWHMEMDEKSFNKYAEIQKANYQPETRVIESIADFLIQNHDDLRRTTSFGEAMDRLNKMYEDGYME